MSDRDRPETRSRCYEGLNNKLEYTRRRKNSERNGENSDALSPSTDFKRVFYGIFTKYGASNPTRNCYIHFTNVTVRFVHLLSHSSGLLITAGGEIDADAHWERCVSKLLTPHPSGRSASVGWRAPLTTGLRECSPGPYHQTEFGRGVCDVRMEGQTYRALGWGFVDLGSRFGTRVYEYN